MVLSTGSATLFVIQFKHYLICLHLPSDVVCTYQAMHSSLCYKYHTMSAAEGFLFFQKHSNLPFYGIVVLSKIKYPLASGGLCPQTLCFNTRVSPSPLDQPLILTPFYKILDPPLMLILHYKFDYRDSNIKFFIPIDAHI